MAEAKAKVKADNTHVSTHSSLSVQPEGKDRLSASLPSKTAKDGTKEFIVSQRIPDSSLVYDNHVYISPSDAAGFLDANAEGDQYVQLNNGPVFIIRAHSEQAPGKVGLAAYTRLAAGVTVGSSCPLTRWYPQRQDDQSILALCIRFQVKIFTEKLRVEISEDEIVELIQQRYTGHVFTRGQEFAVQYKERSLLLEVQTIEVADTQRSDEKGNGETKGVALGDAICKYAVRGMLASGVTRAICQPDPGNRFLIWEKSAMTSPALLRPDFNFADMGIGGLDAEFSSIFRRAFASRLFPPAVISQIGIKHVRGMLLYGPPGTGKTLIARKIGMMLSGREPKVVNGPEILNRYVGASEENIRRLFIEAEEEYAQKGDASSLHIIIFDEIDAICRQRGSDRSGTGVGDTVVNQLLSKIDGVNLLNNILVIGMTNRKDMIDDALLRPGRLEVHVEIGLPDESGRLQILKIHTHKMRQSSILARDVNLEELATQTRNYSGAEIEGLVRSATSHAMFAKMDVSKLGGVSGGPKSSSSSSSSSSSVVTSSDIKSFQVTREHFQTALGECKPAFGVAEDKLAVYTRNGMLDWGEPYRRVLHTGKMLVKQVAESTATSLLSVLIEGAPGSGKTALAAKLALDSGFPYVKVISPADFVDASERGKVMEILKIFEDAYKSPRSLIILDDLERLVEYVRVGPRFSNTVLQCLMVLLKKQPKQEGRNLMVVATTSDAKMLREMDMTSCFGVTLHMPQLSSAEELRRVVELLEINIYDEDWSAIAKSIPLPIGIKQLSTLLEMAASEDADGVVSTESLQNCINACNFASSGSAPLYAFAD